MIAVWLFLTVPLVCLQFVIVVFSDHTYSLTIQNKPHLGQNFFYDLREFFFSDLGSGWGGGGGGGGGYKKK